MLEENTESKPKRVRRKKSGVSKTTIADPVNLGLKKRFQVSNINYISDNGIIQNGWLVSTINGVDDAIKLLQAQKAPIYILGVQASAFVRWGVSRSRTLRGELWMNQKRIEDFEFVGEIDYIIIKQYMEDWCKKVGLE